MEEEFRRRHKQDLFEVLSPFLEGAAPREYEVAAKKLGMTKGAVAVAVHRMRGRLLEILRSEVQQTVTDATETEAELRELLSALAKR
ncbi:MAG: hypothetical protein IT580_24375 [Verrucomicrobiales bacterium]|nr:hypothetical protein [Verrucomicrobiales bacterium]